MNPADPVKSPNTAHDYVFIVGLPRTGTKLLKNLLENSSERECQITPENFFLGRFLRKGVRHKMRELGELSQDHTIDKLVELMYSGELWGEYWDRLASGDLPVERGRLRQDLLDCDRSEKAIYAVLLQAHVALKENSLLGDKTGPHLYRVPTLLEWFPDAKIVHTFRDPRAVMASEHKKRVRQAERLVTEAREARRSLRAVLYWWRARCVGVVSVVYVAFAWSWAARLDRKYKRLYPKNYYLSQYEDLVNHPEASAAKICEFLEIEFQDGMLEPPQVDSSFGQQASTGFNKAGLEHWKAYLRPWMLAVNWVFGGRLLKRFGYR